MNDADSKKKESTGNHVNCNDRERIFEDGSSAEWAALELHAATCPACAEEVRGWKSLSLVAAEMRDYSASPALWPRIQRSLAEQAGTAQQAKSRWSWDSWGHSFAFSWQTALAGAMVLLLVAGAGWFRWHQNRGGSGVNPGTQSSDLLRTNALAEVERTQSAYMHAIDKLAIDAKAQLDNADAPLLANYREKLQVLDSAIDDLRAQTGENPSNAHLRYQLLAMYQEKQRTLQEVLEIKR